MPAERAAGHRREPLDPELVEERALGSHHVRDGDHREVRAVRPAGRRVERRRPRRPAAAAEQVRGDDEVAVGVERLAGADHPVPPAEPLARPRRRGPRRRSRRGCSAPPASFEKPAAWASPLSAWQTRITLSRARRERRRRSRRRRGPGAAPARSRAAPGSAGRDTASRPFRPSRRRAPRLRRGRGHFVLRGVTDVYCPDFLTWESRLRQRGVRRDDHHRQRSQRTGTARRARSRWQGAPEAAQFTWRASSKWENGVHSTTTIQNFFGLGEEQSHKTETVVRRRPSGDLRRRGQRDHADRVPARRAGELPDGGRRVGGAESRDPAALGRVDGRGQPRHPRDPRRRQRRPQRLQRHQGDVRRSTRTPRRQEIEALVAQSQKRSAVFDALTNPTEVTVEVA